MLRGAVNAPSLVSDRGILLPIPSRVFIQLDDTTENHRPERVGGLANGEPMSLCRIDVRIYSFSILSRMLGVTKFESVESSPNDNTDGARLPVAQVQIILVGSNITDTLATKERRLRCRTAQCFCLGNGLSKTILVFLGQGDAIDTLDLRDVVLRGVPSFAEAIINGSKDIGSRIKLIQGSDTFLSVGRVSHAAFL